MSGKKIGIEKFFKPVKTQPSKTNDLHEDGIEKTPQSQTRKNDSSKIYHPAKDFRFLGTMFGNQKQSARMIKKISMFRF